MKAVLESVDSHEKLEAYQGAIAFLTWVTPVLEDLAPVGDLNDQLERASTSIVLNIAQGHGKFSPPERCALFESAHGSAVQCAALLDIFAAKAKIEPAQIVEGKELLLQKIAPMLLEQIKQGKRMVFVHDESLNDDADEVALEELTDDEPADTAATAAAAKVRIPAKPASVVSEPSRNGAKPQPAPAAPAAKPKPPVDEEAEPRIARKYWITLAVCACLMVVTWLFSGSGIPSPETLANQVLTAGNAEDRINAAVTLGSLPGPDATRAIYRLAAESTDPEVLIRVYDYLATRDPLSQGLNTIVLDNLTHADKNVRDAAFETLVKTKPLSTDEIEKFRANDSPSQAIVSDLRSKYRMLSPEEFRQKHAGIDAMGKSLAK